MLHISYRLVFIRVSGVVIFNLLLLIVNMEKKRNLKLRKERVQKKQKGTVQWFDTSKETAQLSIG